MQYCKLPDYLDNKVFDELGATYVPNPIEAVRNLNNDDKKNKIYLGTYFPRTYIETLNIFSELFKNYFINSRFEKRKELKILDIGSGTGASIIGILDYFAQNNLHGNIKITVYSVDGNENALQYQNKLFQSCLENSKLKAELIQTCKKFPLQEKDFKAELYDIMEEFDQTYDIIITSKFLSELYDVKNKNARNLYFNFASVASEYLCRDSLLILSDVTIRTQAEFIPIIMKKELHEFSKKEKSKLHKGSRRLQYVLPLSCAFWYQKCRNYENCFTQKIFNVSHSQKEVDKSKITLNVFSQKSIVEKILHHADEKDKYFCNAQKPNQACCKGKLEHFNNLNDSERLDGFSLQ